MLEGRVGGGVGEEALRLGAQGGCGEMLGVCLTGDDDDDGDERL